VLDAILAIEPKRSLTRQTPRSITALALDHSDSSRSTTRSPRALDHLPCACTRSPG
jgi:hypothetical protein